MYPLIVALAVSCFCGTATAADSVFNTQAGPVGMTHTYEVKIRLSGKVSTTQVQASDAGHAKKLVKAQYGPSVTVLSVKRLD